MMAVRLIVTEELSSCPGCGAPPVKTGDRQRQCNACGLVWERRTAADEEDDEADRMVRSRGWNERNHGSTKIPKGQTRW